MERRRTKICRRNAQKNHNTWRKLMDVLRHKPLFSLVSVFLPVYKTKFRSHSTARHQRCHHCGVLSHDPWYSLTADDCDTLSPCRAQLLKWWKLSLSQDLWVSSTPWHFAPRSVLVRNWSSQLLYPAATQFRFLAANLHYYRLVSPSTNQSSRTATLVGYHQTKKIKRFNATRILKW